VLVVLLALGQVDRRLRVARAQPGGSLAAYLGPAPAVAGTLRASLRLARLVTAGLVLTRPTRARLIWDGRPVGRMEEVMQGEAVRITLRFADAAGAPVVVGAATLRAKPPTGAVRTYPLTAGAAVGEWAGTVLFDAPGRWWIEGDCLTPTPAVTPSLMVTVRPRAAPPA
jgi:hypothetical protein